MKRAFMFTAYELIICVTPYATRGELALSGKKQKTIPLLIPRYSGGFYSAKSNAKKLPVFFSKGAQTSIFDLTFHLVKNLYTRFFFDGNSRHTILSSCFQLRRANTSRDRKISFEICRCSKYGGSNYGNSLMRVC